MGLMTGAALSACGAQVVLEDEGAGGAGGSNGTTATSTKATSASDASSSNGFTTGSSSSSTGSGMTMCGAYSMEPGMVPTEGPCSVYFTAQYICYPKLSPNYTCAEMYPPECFLEAYGCGLQSVGNEVCRPIDESADCCVTVVGDCPVGRPFVVDGTARLATLRACAGWDALPGAERPSTADLDDATRQALADFWAEEALTEHASIASFSRFVLQLLALGAPADLIEDATRAASDEHGHARVAFAFASAYAGRTLGPSTLDITGAIPTTLSATDVAVATASEGCIAETVSAMQIRAASGSAKDPAIRAALERIAEEEMAHAELAWRTLRWLLTRGDVRMREKVERVFLDAAAHVGIGPLATSPGDDTKMLEHGYLPADERRRLAASAIRQVVAPCAKALMTSLETGRCLVERFSVRPWLS